jgi:hypothetical protein
MTNYNVKLTDAGSNTLEFAVDQYNEIDVDYDIYSRSTDASLKHYNIAMKKQFILGLKNITDTIKSSLKTIYDLRVTLNFYRHADDGAYTAQVVWKGAFNLHTPTNKSTQFLERLYAGTITLEEI